MCESCILQQQVLISLSFKSAVNKSLLSNSYLRPVLYLIDAELHRDVEAVQDVASKHQGILRGVDSMDPSCMSRENSEYSSG